MSGRTGERGRRASRDESTLFRTAMRDAAPRRADAPLPDAAPPASGARARETPAIAPAPAAPVPVAPALPDLAPGIFAGIDKRSALRLKRGQTPIEDRLDLHGMTQAEAHRALNGFVAEAAAIGHRCVLVITGKGRAGSEGVLRRMVPHWLNQATLRPLILGVARAQPRDGGSGALYLLLRRRR